MRVQNLKTLRILIYALMGGVLLFITTAILPELEDIQAMSTNVAKWIYFVIIGLFLVVVKEKLWIKVISLILSLFVFMLLVVLFVP